MTTATQAQTVNAQVFLFVLAVVALITAYVGLRGLRHRVLDWWDRRDERRSKREAAERRVRRITKADMNAEAMRLEAECYADALPPTLPPPSPTTGSWVPQQGRHTTAVEVWQPHVTPLEMDRPAPVTASLMRIPGYLPDPFHAQTYAGRAASITADLRDGRPVYDEDAYTTHVLQGLSRPETYVDAPVSPAPWDYDEYQPRRAWGRNRGTDTQRLDPAFTSWEQNTGAWPVLAIAGAS